MSFWCWKSGIAARFTANSCNLKLLRVYTLPADRILFSDRQLFLGLSFRWGQELAQCHTARFVSAFEMAIGRQGLQARILDR